MSNFKPAELDIEIWKNDSWMQSFTLTLDSTPIDLTGATVKIDIKKQCGDTTAISMTNGDGISVGGVNNNSITVNKVINIDAGNYVWDMQVTFTTGVVKTYLWGNFIVSQDITQ